MTVACLSPCAHHGRFLAGWYRVSERKQSDFPTLNLLNKRFKHQGNRVEMRVTFVGRSSSAKREGSRKGVKRQSLPK